MRIHPRFLLAADTGGATGSESLTLKQQLDAKEKQLEQLQGNLTQANADKEALTTKLTEASSSITALKGEKDALQTELTAAAGEVTKLQGEQKTTSQRAAEIAARNNVAAVVHAAAEHKGGTPDGKALFARYQDLMKAESTAEASTFWDTHEKALLAYAASAEARGN